MKNTTLGRFLKNPVASCPQHWCAPLACCARCGAAYESALHRLCAAEQRAEEAKAGWR